MKSALIPAMTGGRLWAWTCTASDSCRGCYGDRLLTHGRGTAEEAAETHYARIGYKDLVRVHVVDSGRGHTFRVWRSRRGIESREVVT